MPGRCFVGKLGHRVLAGAHRVVDRLAKLAGAGGLEVMVGQLGEVRLGIGGVQLLERVGDLAVESHAAGGRDVAVERLADQRVGEGVAAKCAGALHHDSTGDGLLNHAGDALLLGVACGLERGEREFPPDHGRRCEHACGLLGQRFEASADRVAYTVGNRDLVGVGDRVGLEPALGRQQSHHLVDEERVALRGLVHGLRQGRRRIGAREPGHELAHLRLREPTQRKPPAFAPEVGQQRPDLGHQPRLGVAVGAYDEDLGVAQLAREETQKEQ